MRGTCLRAKFRKQDAPWLAMDAYEEDSEASITFKEFRNLAWEAANERARELGWVRSCGQSWVSPRFVQQEGLTLKAMNVPHTG